MKLTLDNILQWSATVLTILGAALTSMNCFPGNVVAFNIGSVLWVWFAIRAKSPAILTTNVVLLGIYMFGMVRAII